MTKDLNQHLKDHFDEVRPTEEAVTRLKEITALKTESHPRPILVSRRMAAVIPLLVLLGGLFFEQSTAVQKSAAVTIDSIAAEIVANHEKYDRPTHQLSSFDALGAHLKGLGFKIVKPVSWSGDGLTVTGGRYCSLLGQKAVQIHLIDEKGQRVTLYQTRAAPLFDRLREGEARVRSKNVTVWTEGDVYFGLASEL